MKKNKFITKLVLSCVTLSASLLLSNQAFANPAEESVHSEKIITESSQKLSQLKETKQKVSEQQIKKNSQLSTLDEKIKKIQIDLDHLKKLKSIGNIVNTSTKSSNQSENISSFFSPIVINDNTTSNTLDEKNEQLTELKQQQESLKTETQTISKQQSQLNDQEAQLSEQVAQAKKQQTEQAKQSDTGSAIVAAAKSHLGKPYVYGAAGPDAFDCSGLVQVAFASAGRSIGRTTVDQESAGTTIPVSDAKAGDLVFWGSQGGTYHVGISTGDGSYIHAPVPGDVVQVATVASYAPDFAIHIV
ncbi:NlpC/P60 family protein [Enterococcus quebecensis]|uniref:NlpC/P60 domain-containing protein n=1 Tax=Enterococcus quebecensis TaxID=903983 RepID=A0A1E5GWZ7_9ENTE|nr:C40 family peptidase [Enterococcus quebecensis]OEG17193.1 hypothetical protein BCR23_04095 [Enterococcus quebecensis]OJG75584.1 hypothetical protein RV12_GL001387 [Enterococcus quebecensis]